MTNLRKELNTDTSYLLIGQAGCGKTLHIKNYIKKLKAENKGFCYISDKEGLNSVNSIATYQANDKVYKENTAICDTNLSVNNKEL